ncbi:MAG TPA: hypothetical protein VMV96_01340 [Acidimicrobiales bacterium]|nr:hypothetical protein [Acidimicrobiales bacterium]
MTDRSPVRRELEASIRSLLPSPEAIKGITARQTPTTAVAGVGGLLAGYAWGWIRGRRSRKRRQR